MKWLHDLVKRAIEAALDEREARDIHVTAQRITVGANDAVILKADAILTVAQVERIRQTWLHRFQGVDPIVLDRSIDVAILRRGEFDACRPSDARAH